MIQNSSASTQTRWSFHLVEEKLELAIDDAAQFIGDLGFDPWAFDAVELISTARHGAIAIAEFTVIGAPRRVEALRSAHGEATSSSTRAAQAHFCNEPQGTSLCPTPPGYAIER